MHGIDLARAFVRQTGETTARAVNVRAFDALEDRRRGGSRDGVARWIDDPLAGVIQGIGAVAATGEQFIIGYYPFNWPAFVIVPDNYVPIRDGGSGDPQLPGLLPQLSWAPGATTLFEDEAFTVTHYNPVALDPRDGLPLAGVFTFDVLIGSLFGHVAEREVIATFTPTDATTFRSARSTYTFRRKKTPTKVSWTPTSPVSVGSAISDVLDAVGQNKATSASVPGTVDYDCYYIDPDTAERVVLAPPSAFNFDAGTTYFFRALFTPSDTVRFESSRLSATVDVSGGPPYTFYAIDLFTAISPSVVGTAVVKDSNGDVVFGAGGSGFTDDNLPLWNFIFSLLPLTTYDGPVAMTVGDNMQLDGGGQATWHYVYP